LVLFVLFGAVAVSAVSASVLVTVDNLKVENDLEVDGDIISSDFVYTFPQTRIITYTGLEFISDQENGKREQGQRVWLEPTGTSIILRSPAHTIPVGSVITGFECTVIDTSGDNDVSCLLLWCHRSNAGCVSLSTLESTGTPGQIPLSETLDSELDRVSAAYMIAFKPDSTACDSDCKLVSARITYDVFQVGN